MGATLAEHLAGEGHSVTIVDVSGDTLDRLGDQLDVMCLKGNCVSREVLLEAGAKETDVLIAATDSDEINLLCCHIAHRLGLPYTVARVRGTEYVSDLDTLKGDFGITMLINPELTAAIEISRLLRFPSASNIDSFARGRVELVSFTVQEGDFLAGRTLASLSSKIQGLPLLLCAVERGGERCRELAEEFPHALIIHGDGTDPELLTEERMASSDAFVALTDRDEDNLIISLYAHQAGVPKVVAKSSRQNYTAIARSAGVESVVSPKLATAGQILRFIRGLQNSKGTVMTALYRIAGGKAEAMEFIVSPATRNLNVPLRDLRLRRGVLIAVIVRGNRVIIPEGSTCLEQGDDVIVIARDSGILDLNDIYEGGGL